MRLRLLIVTIVCPTVCLAQATIEGRVELPKTRSAPVMSKRYEIVTHGGVLATNPPVAIVYLDGAPANGTPPVKQVAQKDLAFGAGRDACRVPKSRRHLSQHLLLLAGETI
jgi:hypothetical protein